MFKVLHPTSSFDLFISNPVKPLNWGPCGQKADILPTAQNSHCFAERFQNLNILLCMYANEAKSLHKDLPKLTDLSVIFIVPALSTRYFGVLNLLHSDTTIQQVPRKHIEFI